MNETKTKLVVQTFYIGRWRDIGDWRDEQDFDEEEMRKATAFMKSIPETYNRRIIRRTEEVIGE